MRQDPPFDMAYITATHLLELLPEDGPLVVNDPASVRNAPGKAVRAALQGADAADPADARRRRDPRVLAGARRHHPEAAVRQWRGRRSFHLRPGDENLNSLLEMYALLNREPVMVQRYVPEVRQGDKRIILVDGEPVGAVLRVPAEGEARANLHVGGRAVEDRR